MPVQNWTRVSSGIFHDFHTAWIVELQRALNTGLLAAEFYALAEQIGGEIGPDELALPKDSIRSEATESLLYSKKRETLVIRHSSGDDVVALIEIVSPGNKQGRAEVRHFVEKARSALDQRIHLLVVDLFPPGRSNPQGLHGEIWSGLGEDEFLLPPDKPLTLASYVAKLLPVAYIEPIAVGTELPEMPLFLETDRYINVPLEATYRAAYEGVPERWRRVIEGRDGS